MRWVLSLAFLLGSSFGIFAQAADDTETKFLAALDKANNLNWFLQPSPYRATQTGEITLNFKKDNVKKQLSAYKIITERDTKIGTHTTYELSKNSVKEKYEFIVIYIKNGKHFERSDDGDWQQVEKLSKNVGGTIGLSTSIAYKKLREFSETNQVTVDYKYLGKEELNNQTADVYVTVIKRAESLEKGTRTETQKYWFAQDGKILKLDLELIIESDSGFSRSHYTQTWEIDENIKIEAPKISGVQ